MNIRIYNDSYKDKMIEMILEARAALGLSPSVRSDLYNVNSNYLDKGDMFWIAVDENDEVIGCLGYSRIESTNEAFLHRFYIKPSMKRKGIGTLLLKTAEKSMLESGIVISKVHLGEERDKWFESYSFYPKNGYVRYAPRYMKKDLRTVT